MTRANGVFFFDLIEGRKRVFESDKVTYKRGYTKSEILEILANVKLELVAFDQVQHALHYSRLLVATKKLK